MHHTETAAMALLWCAQEHSLVSGLSLPLEDFVPETLVLFLHHTALSQPISKRTATHVTTLNTIHVSQHPDVQL